jgi:hypothetical protein
VIVGGGRKLHYCKTNKSAFHVRLNSRFLVLRARPIRLYYLNVFVCSVAVVAQRAFQRFIEKLQRGPVCITVQNAVRLGELENSNYKRASAALDSINKVKLIGAPLG